MPQKYTNGVTISRPLPASFRAQSRQAPNAENIYKISNTTKKHPRLPVCCGAASPPQSQSGSLQGALRHPRSWLSRLRGRWRTGRLRLCGDCRTRLCRSRCGWSSPTTYLEQGTRLELVTSRTSSGCATSCANRSFIGIDCSNRCRCICQYFFIIFRRANGILCRRQPAYALYSTFSQRTVTLDAPPTVQVKSVRSQPLEVISSVANGESVSTSATV